MQRPVSHTNLYLSLKNCFQKIANNHSYILILYSFDLKSAFCAARGKWYMRWVCWHGNITEYIVISELLIHGENTSVLLWETQSRSKARKTATKCWMQLLLCLVTFTPLKNNATSQKQWKWRDTVLPVRRRVNISEMLKVVLQGSGGIVGA